MSSAPHRRYTEEEYLALEEQAETKSEFYRGEIFAMTGGSLRQALIAANLTRAVMNQLDDSPCTAYSSDLRIKVEAFGLYTYPDLSIICGPPELDPLNPRTATNPRVLFEILSPSTEKYDRGDKFRFYCGIPALEHYVLISQAKPLVEVFSRTSEGDWKLSNAERLEQSVLLPALNITLSLKLIYQRVQFDAPNPPTQRTRHPKKSPE